MKKIIASILSILLLVSFGCFAGCTVKDRENNGSSETGDYEIRYYFENDEGEFVIDASKTVKGTHSVGKSVPQQAFKPYAVFEGYEFDEANPKNRLIDTISLEATAHIDLYYKKENSTPQIKGSYVVKHYFEEDIVDDGNGTFVHDPTKDVSGTLNVGTTYTATPITVPYYVFDANNVSNDISGVISETETLELALYYVRTSYTITVEGGTANKTTAKWGDTVQLTHSGQTTEWEIVSGADTGATIVEGFLIMGKGNVHVKATLGDVTAISNDYYVKPSSSVTATLNVSDPTVKQGVISLYNKSTTINLLGAVDSYYAFTSAGNTATLGVFNGREIITIKSATITTPSVGRHEYTITTNSDKSIVCSLDGNEVLNATEGDLIDQGYKALEVAGRVGSYNDTGVKNCTSITVNSGVMDKFDIKDHFATVLTRVPSVYYLFNPINNPSEGQTLSIVRKEECVPMDGIYGYYDKATELKNKINHATTIEEFIALSEDESYRLGALKQHIKASLGSFIVMYNDCLLMPMVSASQIAVPETDVIMYADVYVRDGRWWVPNAYVLYSSRPAPNDLGVMDMLEKEVDETTDFEKLVNISDKYIDDIVRALSYKGFEYYYWHEYLNDKESVQNKWWFLYTYSGANGDGFKYVGDVFDPDTYSWPHDFRLSGVYFNEAHEAFKTDPGEIMSNYTWMLTRQTVKGEGFSLPYTVTLNANGGTLDNNVLTGNMDVDLQLPIPTKTGATFEGWFQNRAFEGPALFSIAKGTNKKDLELYAKWTVGGTEQTLNVDPADVFGSNMIIQRNQPFNVFGSGIDGTVVTVSLDSITKTATVENGKWNVTFEAMEATFEPKTLSISGGDTSYTFTGVLVGEVWLGAGQSNMQMSPSWMNATGVNYVGQYGYYDNFENIRIYRQQVPGTPYDGDPHQTNTWAVMRCPNDALAQSALGLSFALNLQQKLGVPVGVIASCMGATYIEEWLSRESLTQTGSVITGTAEENEECRYYDGMTELLRGIKIAGVIWYQGENNAYAENNPQAYPNAEKIYDKQLVALHAQYKDIFGNQDIPMVVVELAPYAWDDYKDFRLVQRKVCEENKNMYLVSTVDIGNPYDIHPVFKNELGKRISRVALQYVYNDPTVTQSLNFVPLSATKSGNTITITFNANENLMQTGALIGFTVMDRFGNSSNVSASISGNTVILTYTGAYEISKVYYMYGAAVGTPGLYGTNGLPVAPFVIDIK